MITEEGKKLVNIDHEGAYVPYDSVRLEFERCTTTLVFMRAGAEVARDALRPLGVG